MSKRDTPKEKSSSPCEVSVGSLGHYDRGTADIGRRDVEEQHPVEVEAKSWRGLNSVGHTSER